MSSLGGLMTEYIFKTPTVSEGPAGGHRLFYFYTLERGISIVKDNGVYEQARYLLDEDLASFEEVYLGGRNHVVSEATKAALIAGDVGVTESNFTAI
jgi:hypothetical protein